MPKRLFSMLHDTPDRPSPEVLQTYLKEAERFGIDISLLEGNLQLSPTERLLRLEDAAQLILDFQIAREKSL